jgi:hypothetical protein
MACKICGHYPAKHAMISKGSIIEGDPLYLLF